MIYKEKYRINSQGVLYIPPGVSFVPPREFKRDKKITKVVVGKDVRYLGEEAFFGCLNLEEVVFESGSKCVSINKKCFHICLKLRNIEFPIALKQIGARAFQYDFSLSRVYFPIKVSYIDDGAFLNCIGLQEVSFGNSLISLGAEVFWGCVKLRKFLLPRKEIPIKFFHYNIVALNSCFDFQGGKACTYTMCDYCEKGKIKGDKYYYFFLEGNKYIGVGTSLREAYQEAFFLKTNTVKQRAIEEKWTLDTLISMDDYRAISGDCLIGVEEFLNNYHIPLNSRYSIRKVIKLVQGAGFFDNFMNFVREVIIPNTPEEKRKI